MSTSKLYVEGEMDALYTWLAWQKKPGQALVSTINADLIDIQSAEIQAFNKWLARVFTPDEEENLYMFLPFACCLRQLWQSIV